MTALLDKLLIEKRIPQAMLFVHGKLEDALSFAAKLLEDKDRAGKGFHPDLHVYGPDEKSGLYPLALLQQLLETIAFAPFEASCKVCILQEAEKMLLSGSNALLKTLEEPPSDTFFILLSSDERALLATIRSRLYPFYFSPPYEVVREYTSFFTKATTGEWDTLLDELSSFEEEKESEAFFTSYLYWVKKHLPASSFLSYVEKVSSAKLSLLHHIRPKAVFLELLIELYTEQNK